MGKVTVWSWIQEELWKHQDQLPHPGDMVKHKQVKMAQDVATNVNYKAADTSLHILRSESWAYQECES